MRKNLVKKVLLVLAISTTLSFAGQMADSNEMMKKSGNAESKMSCGAGKCGGDIKKPTMPMQEEGGMMKKSGNAKSKMSCGAGKCGSSM